MKILIKIMVIFASIVGLGATSAWATPSLFDYNFNSNGTVDRTGVDVSSFDDVTGLGTISFTTSILGSNSFLAFFDHDIIDEEFNYQDEFGRVTGTPATGQSWEIDEPWLSGDIYTNFENSALDNSNAVPENSEDDVSMAMGWDFSLAPAETATITLTLSEQMPTSGFFLTQWDIKSDTGFYFSGNLDIRDGGQEPVPEPATMLLFGTGLAGLAGYRRRQQAKKK